MGLKWGRGARGKGAFVHSYQTPSDTLLPSICCLVCGLEVAIVALIKRKQNMHKLKNSHAMIEKGQLLLFYDRFIQSLVHKSFLG